MKNVVIIGKQGCGSCQLVINSLLGSNLEYNYLDMSKLNPAQKRKYMAKARAVGQLSMPIILDDEDNAMTTEQLNKLIEEAK